MLWAVLCPYQCPYINLVVYLDNKSEETWIKVHNREPLPLA